MIFPSSAPCPRNGAGAEFYVPYPSYSVLTEITTPREKILSGREFQEVKGVRILILSVTAGEGHNTCAAALREALERRGHEVTVADLYRCCGVPSRLTDRIYRTCAKDFRQKYSRTYTRLERDERFRRRWEKRFLPGWLYLRMKAWMLGREYDCAVCMHVFAARVLTGLRQQGLIRMPILGVNTDYCLHPYWEDCPGLDGLVIPTEEMREEVLHRNIPQDIILPLGIPIRSPGRCQTSREEARAKLGLPGGKLVLLMGGSMGYGHIFSTALALRKQEITTVCVCGRNRVLRERLLPFRNDRLRVLGYTRLLPEYMAAADLAVTKPGGLSLTELAAARVPAVLTSPIPGHEERNLRLWTRLGAAAEGGGDGESTALLVTELLADEGRLRKMRSALEALSPQDAAENLCRFVETLDKTSAYD